MGNKTEQGLELSWALSPRALSFQGLLSQPSLPVWMVMEDLPWDVLKGRISDFASPFGLHLLGANFPPLSTAECIHAVYQARHVCVLSRV